MELSFFIQEPIFVELPVGVDCSLFCLSPLGPNEIEVSAAKMFPLNRLGAVKIQPVFVQSELPT